MGFLDILNCNVATRTHRSFAHFVGYNWFVGIRLIVPITPDVVSDKINLCRQGNRGSDGLNPGIPLVDSIPDGHINLIRLSATCSRPNVSFGVALDSSYKLT